MTLPNKPWTVFRDGSANTIKDSLGQAIAYVPDYRVAEHIVERVNLPDRAYAEAIAWPRESLIAMLLL